MDLNLLTESDISIESSIFDDEGEEIGTVKFGATARSKFILFIAKETRDGLMIRKATQDQ